MPASVENKSEETLAARAAHNAQPREKPDGENMLFDVFTLLARNSWRRRAFKITVDISARRRSGAAVNGHEAAGWKAISWSVRRRGGG